MFRRSDCVFPGWVNPGNRWVKVADLVPWEEVESEYARQFKSHGQGEVALIVRIAPGPLLICGMHLIKEFLLNI